MVDRSLPPVHKYRVDPMLREDPRIASTPTADHDDSVAASQDDSHKRADTWTASSRSRRVVTTAASLRSDNSSTQEHEMLHRHVKVVVDNPTSLHHVAEAAAASDMTGGDPAPNTDVRRKGASVHASKSRLKSIILAKTGGRLATMKRIYLEGAAAEANRPSIQPRPPRSMASSRFMRAAQASKKYTLKRSLSFFAASTRSYDPNVLRHTLEEMQDGRKYLYVLHPMGMAKVLWDFTTALFVLVYCWLVPVQMCFDFWDPGPSVGSFIVFLDVWFIVDMVVRFRTGVVECGVVIMNPSDISKLYMKSVWFYLDLFSSLPVEIFLGNKADSFTGATTRHTVKLVKYLKIPKLLRLGRLLKNLRRYKGYTGMLTIMGSLFFLVHACACIWVLVLNPCDENTLAIEPLCDDARFSELYIMSFEVAITALLGVSNAQIESTSTILGGAHKTGTQSCDRGRPHRGPPPGTPPPYVYLWFAIVQPVGVIYTALIFGNVITMVHSFNRIGNAFRKKMDQVYHEMESLSLPKPIRTRVLAYYDYLWNRNLSETMTLLNDKGMSEPLRHQIAIYLYKDQLLKIPFFQHASDDVLGMICMMLRQVVYMPNDFIFKEVGCVEVLPSERATPAVIGTNDDAILLADGDFFGEIGIVMEGFNSILGDFPEFANEMKKLVVKRITMLYGNRNLSSETLAKITAIAEKNMQRRIRAYGEVVNHHRRKPSGLLLGRRGAKFDLLKRLDIRPENEDTTAIDAAESDSHSTETSEEDEIDDKLVSAKVWKIARQMRRIKADAAARDAATTSTLATILTTIQAMQAKLDVGG
ncbi:hypothetical protein DYB32_000918 [Aphanomyces invadans]|uniref:Ion transport domain-containing protein n=1 Tax=Aphanomyces invadans TaxID=157072 RepID=A0A418B8H1_9STRA|nr:hypothetical protein DYB32_000918 [Aphanomyces invadans]